jgi:hypothetical protein
MPQLAGGCVIGSPQFLTEGFHSWKKDVSDELFSIARGIIPHLLSEKNGKHFQQKIFINYFNNI